MKKFLDLLTKISKIWNSYITVEEAKKFIDDCDKDKNDKLQIKDLLILIYEELKRKGRI